NGRGNWGTSVAWDRARFETVNSEVQILSPRPLRVLPRVGLSPPAGRRQPLAGQAMCDQPKDPVLPPPRAWSREGCRAWAIAISLSGRPEVLDSLGASLICATST